MTKEDWKCKSSNVILESHKSGKVNIENHKSGNVFIENI